MEEKEYTDQIERMNKRRNKMLRIGLVLLAVVLIAALIALAVPFSEHDYQTHRTGRAYDTYINGVYVSRSYETKSTPNPYTVPLIAVVSLATVDIGILVACRKKDICDYRKKLEKKMLAAENGSFSGASPRRKRLFYLSLFLGYTGMDRFVSGCIFKGLLKFALFFVFLGTVGSLDYSYTSSGAHLEDWILFGIFLALMLLFWIRDFVALRKGVYKGRKGEFIA